MTYIYYNYNTEYTIQWKQSVAWYDIAINSTIKTYSLRVKFLSSRMCIRFDGLRSTALDLLVRGCELECRCKQDFFILLFSVFSLCSSGKPMQMKSTMTYT